MSWPEQSRSKNPQMALIMPDVRLRRRPGYEVVGGDGDGAVVIPRSPSPGERPKAISPDTKELLIRIEGGEWAATDIGLSGEDALRLVLEDLLEVDCDGGYISGVAYADQLPNFVTGTDRTAHLSHAALSACAAAKFANAGTNASFLYLFNTAPANAARRESLCSAERIRRYLGLRDIAPSLRGYSDNTPEDSPLKKWWYWRSQSQEIARARGSGGHKLYVSPEIGSLTEAFPVILETLASMRTPAFKVGCDMFGLLRPDKVVAYFGTLEHLLETAFRLAERLSGCRAQGVPFTCAVTDNDGLLSRGYDPPSSSATGARSWRGWVAQMAGQWLRQAQVGGAVEPEKYVLARFVSNSVDVNSWIPDETAGRQGWS